MEAIAAKLLRKYLSVFFKNIKKENISLNMSEGKAELTKIELNEPAIQELCLIPTNLLITKTICNHVLIRANWTKLKHDPILLVLDRVEITLREPETIPPKPNVLSSYLNTGTKISTSSSDNQKKMSNLELILNTTLIVNEIIIRIETLPSLRIPQWKTPTLFLIAQGLRIESTNEQGDVVDLAKSKVVDKNIQTLFKKIALDSISISLQPLNREKFYLLERLPLTITMSSIWNTLDANWLGGTFDILMETAHIQVSSVEWGFVHDFILCLKQAFSRPIPEEILKPSSETIKSNQIKRTEPKMDFKFVIDHWLLQILENKESGLKFQGCGININFLNKQSISDVIANKPPSNINSFLTINLPIIKLECITPQGSFSVLDHITENLLTLQAKWKPSKNRMKKSTPSNSSISSKPLNQSNSPTFSNQSNSSISSNQSNLSLLSTPSVSMNSSSSASSRSSLISEEDIPELFEELQLDGNMNGVNINIDLLIWEKIVNLLVPSDILAKLNSSEQNQTSASNRKKINLVKDWNDIKFNFEVQDTTVLLHSGTRKLELKIRNMNLMNDPIWQELPLVKNIFEFSEETGPVRKGSRVNEQKENQGSKLDPFKKLLKSGINVGSIYRLDGNLKGLTLSLIHETNVVESPLLRSSNVNLNLRYFQIQEEQVISHLEIGLHYGELHFKVEDFQFLGLYYFIKDLWKVTLGVNSRPFVNSKETLSQIMPDGQNLLASSHSLKNKINFMLGKYVFTFCSRSEKGVFETPLHSLYYAYKESKLQRVATQTNPLSKISYEGFSFGFQNIINSQTILLSLKTMKAEKIDHPRFPYFLLFTPLYQENEPLFDLHENRKEKHQFDLSYTKVVNNNEQAIAKLKINLQEMQIQFEQKKEFETRSIGSFDIHEIFSRFVALFDSKKQYLLETLDNLKTKSESEMDEIKMETDLDWEVELGGCIILFQDGTTKKKNGILRLSNSRTKDVLFQELQTTKDELNQVKMEMMQLKSENEKLKRDLKKIPPPDSQLVEDLEAFKELFKQMQDQYLTTKLKLSDLEINHTALKNELKQKSKK